MLTNFPYGVSSFGVPSIGNIPAQSGNYFFVDATNGVDGNDGQSWGSAVKTIAQAYSLCVSGHNDTIVLSANASHSLTAMLDMSKSRVHIIGTGAMGAFKGQRSKISMGVTTATTDVYAVKVTGTGCSLSNVKVISNNTLSQNVAALYAGGEACTYNNISVENLVSLDQTGDYDVIFASDSSTYNNCMFGTTTVQKSVARHTCLMGVDASSPVKDNMFNDCTFANNSTSTSSVNIKAGTADCINFSSIFRGTVFDNVVNAGAGSVAPTVVVATNVSVTGKLMFDANTFIGVGSKLAASTLNVGVWINAPSTPTANTSGVAVLGA